MFPSLPAPRSAGEPALPRLGAALADSLAAVRVALELLGGADSRPSPEVIALARRASRKAEIYRELLAALARAHSLPLPGGASEACAVLRRALSGSGRDDRDAGTRVACPGGDLLPVALPVAVLRPLFLAWWRGTRAVLREPGPIVLAAVPGAVEVRCRGRFAVSREHLEVACGARDVDRLAAVPLPPDAWFLAVAGVLARRSGGEVRTAESGPVLALPPYPSP